MNNWSQVKFTSYKSSFIWKIASGQYYGIKRICSGKTKNDLNSTFYVFECSKERKYLKHLKRLKHRKNLKKIRKIKKVKKFEKFKNSKKNVHTFQPNKLYDLDGALMFIQCPFTKTKKNEKNPRKSFPNFISDIGT